MTPPWHSPRKCKSSNCSWALADLDLYLCLLWVSVEKFSKERVEIPKDGFIWWSKTTDWSCFQLHLAVTTYRSRSCYSEYYNASRPLQIAGRRTRRRDTLFIPTFTGYGFDHTFIHTSIQNIITACDSSSRTLSKLQYGESCGGCMVRKVDRSASCNSGDNDIRRCLATIWRGCQRLESQRV